MYKLNLAFDPVQIGRLKKAMDDFREKAPALFKKSMEEAVKQGFPNNYEPYVPKVHMFKDNDDYRKRGGYSKSVKDILCRGNSGSIVTNDLKEVTCKRCLSQMKTLQENLPDGWEYQNIRDLSNELDAERDHADKLADFLTMMLRQFDHGTLATVVIPNSNIGLGDVIRGALSFHAEWRRSDDGKE